MELTALYGPADEAESIATIHAALDAGITPFDSGDFIVPLVGARRRDRLSEALGALDLSLSADVLARIEQAFPPGAVSGDRYSTSQMTHLDSERGG